MERTASFVAILRQVTMNNTKDGQGEEVRVVIQPLQVSLDELPASEKEKFGLFAQAPAGGEAPADGEAAAAGEDQAVGVAERGGE